MSRLSFVTGLNDSVQESGKLIRMEDAHCIVHCCQQVRKIFVSFSSSFCWFILCGDSCPWHGGRNVWHISCSLLKGPIIHPVGYYLPGIRHYAIMMQHLHANFHRVPVILPLKSKWWDHEMCEWYCHFYANRCFWWAY